MGELRKKLDEDPLHAALVEIVQAMSALHAPADPISGKDPAVQHLSETDRNAAGSLEHLLNALEFLNCARRQQMSRRLAKPATDRGFRIPTYWACPECDAEKEVDAYELPEVGIPSCDNCHETCMIAKRPKSPLSPFNWTGVREENIAAVVVELTSMALSAAPNPTDGYIWDPWDGWPPFVMWATNFGRRFDDDEKVVTREMSAGTYKGETDWILRVENFCSRVPSWPTKCEQWPGWAYLDSKRPKPPGKWQKR